jgi:hypothetical protein
VKEPEGREPDNLEDLEAYLGEGEASGESRHKSAGRVDQPLRMVYEDELRKAAGERALDLPKQQGWMAFRRSLPINRWIERPHGIKSEKSNIQALRKDLGQYLKTFHAEALELNLKLDMERNYYKEAVNLLSAYPQGERPGAKDGRRLKELMIMVDYKDAKLASQILQSIV